MVDADVASTVYMQKKRRCVLLKIFLNSTKQYMKWKESVCIGDEGAGYDICLHYHVSVCDFGKQPMADEDVASTL